jgi:O-antigen/teichoic acid export membrane protein
VSTAARSPATAVSAASDRLTSGPVLARNTALNLGGQAAPVLVAVVAIPALIKAVGTDRFGVLTLAWALIGYLSVLDLGIGRALTKLVAEKLGTGEEAQIPRLVWTALILTLALGALGMIALALLTPWLVASALKIPLLLRGETQGGFLMLAASLPFVTGSAGLRGVLEAHQRFGLSNTVRIPTGLFLFLAPLAVAQVSTSLVALIGALAVGRAASWAAYLIVCVRAVPGMRARPALARAAVGPLISFGSWMTVNSVVGPVMLTMDRFIIGALVSLQAVALYATPYEIVTKIWLVTGALSSVLFPAFATSFVRDRVRTARLFERGAVYVVLLMLPLSLAIVLFARDGMELWLGPAFAVGSFRVAQLLVIGAFLLGVETIPYALLQGVGRPDLPAKLVMGELPVYLVAVVWATRAYGIAGAAVVWAARAAVDSALLLWLARRFVTGGGRRVTRIAVLASAAVAVLLGGFEPATLVVKGTYLVAALALFGGGAWLGLFDGDDRAAVARGLRAVVGGVRGAGK